MIKKLFRKKSIQERFGIYSPEDQAEYYRQKVKQAGGYDNYWRQLAGLDELKNRQQQYEGKGVKSEIIIESGKPKLRILDY